MPALPTPAKPIARAPAAGDRCVKSKASSADWAYDEPAGPAVERSAANRSAAPFIVNAVRLGGLVNLSNNEKNRITHSIYNRDVGQVSSVENVKYNTLLRMGRA